MPRLMINTLNYYNFFFFDISVLTSAERIERIAEEELGMHKAESEDIVRVEMTGEKKK